MSQIKAGSSTCRQDKCLPTQVAEQMKPHRLRQIKWLCVMAKLICQIFSGLAQTKDKRASEALTNKIHYEFSDVFSGTGCFEGMFTLQGKDGSLLYQAPSRRVAYTSQEPLKEELERL